MIPVHTNSCTVNISIAVLFLELVASDIELFGSLGRCKFYKYEKFKAVAGRTTIHFKIEFGNDFHRLHVYVLL